MSENKIEDHANDLSFIRQDAGDLIAWARRLGLTQQEMRDALDSGLIRPTGASPLSDDKPLDDRLSSAG